MPAYKHTNKQTNQTKPNQTIPNQTKITKKEEDKNKQASKQASNQANEQASNQASKQASKQTSKQRRCIFLRIARSDCLSARFPRKTRARKPVGNLWIQRCGTRASCHKLSRDRARTQVLPQAQKLRGLRKWHVWCLREFGDCNLSRILISTLKCKSVICC